MAGPMGRPMGGPGGKGGPMPPMGGPGGKEVCADLFRSLRTQREQSADF